MEMRWHSRLLHVAYKDHMTNEAVRNQMLLRFKITE